MSVEKLIAAVLLLIATAVLAGCGNAGANKAQAQIVATVNGEGITLQRLDRAALRGHAAMAPDDAADRFRALQDAIDQELLVQRARDARLDRNPEVVQEIDRATRRILAQAYLRQVTSAVSAGTAEEIRAFYKSNPALFAERRVFWLQELQARMTPEEVAALKARVTTARRLKDVARWLRSQRIPFEVAVSTRAAEQIPLHMLDHLITMKDGEVTLFVTPDGVSVVELVQSQAAPLAEEQAAPLIQRYLASNKRLQRTTAEIGKLRQHARIEYGAEFGGLRASRPVAAAVSHAGRPVKAHQSVEQAVSGL